MRTVPFIFILFKKFFTNTSGKGGGVASRLNVGMFKRLLSEKLWLTQNRWSRFSQSFQLALNNLPAIQGVVKHSINFSNCLLHFLYYNWLHFKKRVCPIQNSTNETLIWTCGKKALKFNYDNFLFTSEAWNLKVNCTINTNENIQFIKTKTYF